MYLPIATLTQWAKGEENADQRCFWRQLIEHQALEIYANYHQCQWNSNAPQDITCKDGPKGKQWLREDVCYDRSRGCGDDT